MDSAGHLFNTRYSGNFEHPNFHDEVLDMVVDLNKRFLRPLRSDPARGGCIYNNATCADIEARTREREWLSDNLAGLLQAGGGAGGSSQM